MEVPTPRPPHRSSRRHSFPPTPVGESSRRSTTRVRTWESGPRTGPQSSGPVERSQSHRRKLLTRPRPHSRARVPRLSRSLGEGGNETMSSVPRDHPTSVVDPGGGTSCRHRSRLPGRPLVAGSDNRKGLPTKSTQRHGSWVGTSTRDPPSRTLYGLSPAQPPGPTDVLPGPDPTLTDVDETVGRAGCREAPADDVDVGTLTSATTPGHKGGGGVDERTPDPRRRHSGRPGRRRIGPDDSGCEGSVTTAGSCSGPHTRRRGRGGRCRSSGTSLRDTSTLPRVPPPPRTSRKESRREDVWSTQTGPLYHPCSPSGRNMVGPSTPVQVPQIP